VVFPAKQTHTNFFQLTELGLLERLVVAVGFDGVAKQAIFGALTLITLLRFARPEGSLGGWIAILTVLLLGKVHVTWDKYLLSAVTSLWVLTLFNPYWPFARTRLRWKPSRIPIAKLNTKSA
jgi:hypothetical protein